MTVLHYTSRSKPMAVYNDILVDCLCPACGEQSIVTCQCHIASDFDGDEAGRFCMREYRLGERMVWWPMDDLRFEMWRADESGEPNQPDGEALEACYSTCTRCSAELYAVIRFRDVTPVELVDLGLESNWPAGYLR